MTRLEFTCKSNVTINVTWYFAFQSTQTPFGTYTSFSLESMKRLIKFFSVSGTSCSKTSITFKINFSLFLTLHKNEKKSRYY